MNNIDICNGIPEIMEHPVFERLSKRYNNIFCRDMTTSVQVPDSIFINNSIYVGKPLMASKFVSLEVDTSSSVPEQFSMRSAEQPMPITFKVKSKVVGKYDPLSNILLVCDFTYRFNDFSIKLIESIMDWIENNTPERFVVESFLNVRDEVTMIMGNTTYMLRAISSSPNNKEDFKKQVAMEARAAIIKIREQWSESLKREKERYERLRKSTKVMPPLKFGDMIAHGLRMSQVDNYIVYSFDVSITVKNAIDEAAKKKVALDTPQVYDALLHFYVNEKDILTEVRMTEKDGQSSTHHLHAVDSGTVCVGTTNICGKKISNLSEIFAYKDQLVAALQTFNVYSCYPGSNQELYDEIKAKMQTATPNKMGVWTIKSQSS